MKHIKRTLALILALVLMLTPMVGVGSAETGAGEKTLVVFDLETFLQESLETEQARYDYLKFASALQGLVNRDEPRLYFYSFTNGAATAAGYDMDEYWLDKITDKELGYGELAAGGDLADYQIVKVKSFWKIVEMFENYFNGFVLWQSDVPSTANVASTIAGVENLLPVRKATGGEDLYTTLRNKGYLKDGIKRDLTGLFTGKGYIPTLGSSVPGAKLEYTTTPSTGSFKTDPYIWAKMFYLDTGLTNPLHMTYSIDAGGNKIKAAAAKAASDSGEGDAYAAELVSVYVPEKMAPGEVLPVKFTYMNTGKEAWNNDAIRVGFNTSDTKFELYLDEACTKMVTSQKNRLTMGYCAPEESVTVVGYMRAPYVAGKYMIPFAAVYDGVAWFSSNYNAVVEVKKGGGMTEEEKNSGYLPMNAETAVSTSSEVEIVKVSKIDPTAAGTAVVTVKNVSIVDWTDVALEYSINGTAQTPVALGAAEVGESVAADIAYPAADELKFKLQVTVGGEDVGEPYEFTVSKGQTAATASDYAAELVSYTYPKNLLRGEKGTITLELKNVGTKAWTSALSAQSTQALLSTTSHSDDASPVNKVSGEAVTVEPGATYFFTLDLHSGYGKTWTEPGSVISQTLSVSVGSTELVSLPMTTLINDETVFNLKVTSVTQSDKIVSGYSAQLVSYAIPAAMNVGDKAQPIRVTFKNNGTETWTGESGAKIRFGIDNTKTTADPQQDMKLHLDKDAVNGNGSDRNRIWLPTGMTVEPGQTFTTCAYITPPTAGGLQELQVYMVKESQPAAVLGSRVKVPFVITDPNAPAALMSLEEPVFEIAELPEPELETASTGETIIPFVNTPPAVTSEQYKAAIISATTKVEVEPGEKFPISVTVKNIGTDTFVSNRKSNNAVNSLRVRFGDATVGLPYAGGGVYNDTTFYTNTEKTHMWLENKFYALCANSASNNITPYGGVKLTGNANSNCHRLDLASNVSIASGASETYSGWLVAPNKAGKYTITLDTVADGHAARASAVTFEIEVVEPEVELETIYEDTATVTEPAAAAWGARVKKVEMGSTDKTVEPGEKIPVKITIENIGKDTPLYSAPTGSRNKLIVDGTITLGSANAFGKRNYSGSYNKAAEGHIYLDDRFYALSADGGSTFNFEGISTSGQVTPDLNQYGAMVGKAEKFGDQMVVNAYLIAPKTEGDYTFKFRAYELPSNGTGTFTPAVTIKVEAPKSTEPTLETIYEDTAAVTKPAAAAWGARISKVEMGSADRTVEPGEKIPVKITIENTGKDTPLYSKATVVSGRKMLIVDGSIKLNGAEAFGKRNYSGNYNTAEEGHIYLDNRFYALSADGGDTFDFNGVSTTGRVTGDLNQYGAMVGKAEKFGDQMVVNAYLIAPKTEGEYAIEFRAYELNAANAILGNTGYISVGNLKVGSGSVTPPTPETPTFKPAAEEVVFKTDAQAPVTTKDWAAEILSAAIPTVMAPGSIVPVSVTVKNTGTKTWKSTADDQTNEMRLALNPQVGFEMYNDAAGTKYETSGKNRIQIVKGKEVKSGETYTYEFYLKAPAEGGKTLKPSFALIGERQKPMHTDWLGTREFSIMLEEVYKTDAQAPVTTKEWAGEILSSSMPKAMEAEQIVPVTVTVKNTGTKTWKSTADDPTNEMRLALNPQVGFEMYTDAAGTKFDASDKNRIQIEKGKEVKSGETYTYKFYLKAPDTAATLIPSLALIGERQVGGDTEWQGTRAFSINVTKPYVPKVPVYTEKARDAQVVMTNITPDPIFTDAQGTVTIVVKNIGTETWGDGFYLRCRVNKGEAQYLPVSGTVAPGAVATFSIDFTAPSAEKTYEVEASMVYNADLAAKKTSKYFGDSIVMEGTCTAATTAYAEIVSTNLPETILEGTKAEAYVEVLNTGNITWGDGNTVSLDLINEDAKAVISAVGAADDQQPTASAVIPEGVTVAPGERYIFRFDLHTWELVNEKTEYIRSNTTVQQQMRLKLTEDGEDAYMGEAFDATFKVGVFYEDPEWTELTDPNKAELTGEELSAEFISVKYPEKMSQGQLVPFSIKVKNTGMLTWKEDTNASDGVRLATQSASGIFGFYRNAEGTDYWASDKNRITIDGRVAPGDVYEFSGYLKAPAQPGVYTLDLRLINDTSTPLQLSFGENPNLMLEIEVIGNSVFAEEFVETGTGVTYGDLTTTALGNADYYIAKKAFFWDLAVDPTIAPLDDRGQTPGTDRKVLRELLNSQRKRAQAYEEGRDPWNKVQGVGEGFGIFTVGGFTPWFRKYCNYEDSQSSWAPVDAEWGTIDITSEYGGQTDADAYGTITVSNCSVFSLLKNNVQKFGENLTQTQPDFDPAVGDPTVKYNPNTKYILHYMGDWDGSAWISGILPTLWENDPRRGEIPVGWALATANSERIPHVYNWQYDNATANDFFFFGDNGPAYFNPSWTEDPTAESGVTKAEGHEMTQDFINYTKYYADLFSLDITGFFITGTYQDGPQKHVGADAGAMQAFAEATPYGVGTQANAANNSYYGSTGIETPFIEVKSLGSGLVTDADRASAAQTFASTVKFGKQFVIFRTVKATVTRILDVQERAEKNNPGLNYKVVDPYTFFRLAREAGAYDSEANKANYEAKRASGIKIDGQIGATEWADAAVMTISPTAKEIGEHGYNWAPTALATATDMEAKFRVKYDNEYLYVLEERSDDGEGPTADTSKIDWTADSGAIYLDTDGKWVGSTYYAGDFAVMFNRDASGVPNVWLRKGSDDGKKSERKLEAGEYIAVINRTDSGYVYELAIKWSAIGSFRPTWGKTVGMTMLAIDGDPNLMGGARQIMWHGNGDAQENWGKMTFK